MKIYTSYFYKVRFFKENIYPVSTAVWDPKWFHDNQGEMHIFVDKNGVTNGLKFYPFVPNNEVMGLCKGKFDCDSSPDKCEFLSKYRKQLDSLDFNEIMEDLKSTFDEPDDVIVFMFHETPNNKCSERDVVTDWFRDHGIEVKEWEG